jgi:hypothetical protein
VRFNRGRLTLNAGCSNFVLMLDAADREYLRQVIAVALAVAPRRIKRAFADRTDKDHDAAQRHLSQSAADAVVQCFDLQRKPLPPPGRGVASRPEQELP